MALAKASMGIALLALVVPFLVQGTFAQVCGRDAGNKLCASPNCCSQYGYCGTTSAYCGTGCQSGPCTSTGGTPSPPSNCGSGVGGVVTESQYNSIFPNRNAIYTYSAFTTAASSFRDFGTTGDCTKRRQEIAAFFANIHHETSGLLYTEEIDQSSDYCIASTQYPCAAGKKYFGRGPLQLSWNYNYKQCGDGIIQDLVNKPELVATNGVISFKAAIWFWQTSQSPKPSCHAVMTGGWTPSSTDASAGRQPGFGMTINIINGGQECGSSPPNTSGASSRVGLYKSMCNTFGVATGSNLPCSSMTPYS